MGFTVTNPGVNEYDFESYIRTLRRHVKDIGKAPRVPDPSNPQRRWLYVWDTQEEAQRFADDLTEDYCGKGTWSVVPVADTPSEGPIGPLLIQLSRRADGLSLALSGLSWAVLEDMFPSAAPVATYLFIDKEFWQRYQKTHGDLNTYAEALIPVLTGLSVEQVAELGYCVVDYEAERTLVYAPPVGIAPVPV